MGSGQSYSKSADLSTAYEGVRSTDASAKRVAVEHHTRGVVEAKARIARGEYKPAVEARDTSKLFDARLARNVITQPSGQATDVIVALVDNSGSNRAIADHLKESSGLMMGILGTLNKSCEISMLFGSDHCDGPHREQQYVDFTPPTEEGDRSMYSSIRRIEPAEGGDFPESIECWLKYAASINFAHVPRERRMCVLITDSVPHGMGIKEEMGIHDDLCNVSWRLSMDSVRRAYGRFVLIGSGENQNIERFQKRLFETSPDQVDEAVLASDYLSLCTIRDQKHRNAIVGNALLFMAARQSGMATVELFLSVLYRKWLDNPIFAGATVVEAEKQIRNFGKYLHEQADENEIAALMNRVFCK